MGLNINGSWVDTRNGTVHFSTANDIDRVYFNNVKVWQKNGSYTVNRPAAIKRSFSTKYGTMTFPEVANGYEVGWNYFGIYNSGINNTFQGSSDYETMKTWASSFDFASQLVMVGVYEGINCFNLTINSTNIAFTLIAGGGGIENKQTTTHVYNCVLSTNPRGGTIEWGNDNTNLRVQIIFVPKEDGPTQVNWTDADYELQYNRETGSLGTTQNFGSTGVISNPGFIVRYIYVCPVTSTV